MRTDTDQGQHKPPSQVEAFPFARPNPTQDLAHRRSQPFSVPSTDHAVVVVADPGHLHLCLRRRRGHRKGARPPKALSRPHLRSLAAASSVGRGLALRCSSPPSPPPSSSMSPTAWAYSAPPHLLRRPLLASVASTVAG
jgi:hypothetical protein